MKRKQIEVELTDKYIKSIKPPAAGQVMHHDTLLPSFGLRVSAGGAKTWIVQRQVHGRYRRFTLGQYLNGAGMTLAAAREKARRTLGLIADGKDPDAEAARELAEQKRQAEAQQKLDACTFKVMKERYLAEHCGKTNANGRPRLESTTLRSYRSVLYRPEVCKLDPLPVADITDDAILAITSKVKAHAPYQADRVHGVMNRLMKWCIKRKVIQSNPVRYLDRPIEPVARERVLTAAEIFHLWQCLDLSPAFSRALRLLLVTAQRREEVAGMHSTELAALDGADPLWTIPPERAKNDNGHRVPLSPLAVQLIGPLPTKPALMFTTNGKTPIRGFSRMKRNINSALQKRREDAPDPAIDSLLADWRFHDFRRTAATFMAELGTPRDVVELILNHISGTRAGVAGIYNRSKLLDDRRVALEIWAEYLQRITAERMTDEADQALRRELRMEHRRRLMGATDARPVLQLVERAAA